MAEDEADANCKANLDESDIRTNVYEGGYKSWECSFDLAKLLLDRGPRKDLDDLCRVDHVVEVCICFHLSPKNRESHTLISWSSAAALRYHRWCFSTMP
jgi:hypothetical protein